MYFLHAPLTILVLFYRTSDSRHTRLIATGLPICGSVSYQMVICAPFHPDLRPLRSVRSPAHRAACAFLRPFLPSFSFFGAFWTFSSICLSPHFCPTCWCLVSGPCSRCRKRKRTTANVRVNIYSHPAQLVTQLHGGNRRGMLPVRQQQLGASDTHTVLVVGSLGCGKTALVSRLTNGKHVQQYRPTLGCELSEKEVRPVRRADGLTEGEPGTFGDSGEQSVYYELDHGASLGTVELWDCGGHERFRPLIQQLYRHAQARRTRIPLYAVVTIMNRERFWCTT